MKRLRALCFLMILIMLLAVSAPVAAAGKNGCSWVGAWSTSPVETVVEKDGVKLADFLLRQTVRIVLQPTLDGEWVRIKISNKYGTKPLVISDACIARCAGEDGSDILTDTLIPLAFRGQGTARVPAGEELFCDAVKMDVSALERLAVSYFAEAYTEMRTGGLVGANAYVCPGNQTKKGSLSGEVLLNTEVAGNRLGTIPFLTDLDVYARDAYSIVIIGDSTVCNDIPEMFAEKLVASGVRNIGVLQQAIKGNRLLYDGVGFIGNIYGEAMLSRFGSDALTETGVKKIFVKIGINDILHPRTNSMQGKAPYATAEEIITGYEKLVRMAHDRNIEIYFFSLTPWKGYTREILRSGTPDLIWSEEAEALCTQLNDWITANTLADGFVNLDCLRSEDDPAAMRAGYTDDGIHFTRDAQIEVVDSISMDYFGLVDSHIRSLREIIEGKIAEYTAEESTQPKVEVAEGISSIAPVAPSQGSPLNGQTAEKPAGDVVKESISAEDSTPLPVGEVLASDGIVNGQAVIAPKSAGGGGGLIAALIAFAVLTFAALLALLIGVPVLIIKKRKRKPRN